MVKINDNKFLSKNLKLLRSYIGESQDSFAQIFGLKRTNIASYEGGTEPKLSFLLDVANHFHIKLDDLISCDLNSHMELLDTREEAKDVNAAPDNEECMRLRKENEELKKDKAILAEQIALKDQLIQRQWKEIDTLKSSKMI
jgi:transcriptional regulator with XRE-family HTH domain